MSNVMTAAQDRVELRRTRIVCVSDTHSASPLDGGFTLPKGDVLIHAGDLTNQGTFSELEKTVGWIDAADFECKIVIAGNHDITLDGDFYSQHGARFHNQCLQDSTACGELLSNSKTIKYLNHESSVIRLTSPAGPQTTFKVFGSPYSPACGLWAFGYSPEISTGLWDAIPSDADVVLTHTPPQYSCDQRKDPEHVGCEALRHSLRRVRPRLAICGHVHEGRGIQRVRWDLERDARSVEERGEPWIDPGENNKKMSLVDLTGRKGARLDNDGSVVQGQEGTTDLEGMRSSKHPIAEVINEDQLPLSLSCAGSESPSDSYIEGRRIDQAVRKKERSLAGTRELSTGRRETCVVNAAIMASSWPHKKSGGKRFNKPIVIDVDLPVYEDHD
ncbi:MAG: hypothetical protein M1837_006457 [Sclerophora amabilis]|nr:MAG: hypothetical protein M1837_006457 [Sclerophora amabilis]